MKNHFKINKFTIVTQAFQNERAIFIANHYGLDAIGFNAQDIDIKKGYRVYFREAFARVKVFLDILKAKNRKKRGGGEGFIALDELEECIPDKMNLERDVESREFETAIGVFVSDLPETEKKVFVLRYWFLFPVTEISDKLGFSQSKTKSILFRTRKKLREYLQEEGLC